MYKVRGCESMHKGWSSLRSETVQAHSITKQNSCRMNTLRFLFKAKENTRGVKLLFSISEGRCNYRYFLTRALELALEIKATRRVSTFQFIGTRKWREIFFTPTLFPNRLFASTNALKNFIELFIIYAILRTELVNISTVIGVTNGEYVGYFLQLWEVYNNIGFLTNCIHFSLTRDCIYTCDILSAKSQK